MTFREFITSRLFLKQLLLAIGAAVVVLWISLKLLDAYTLHGRTITVPDLEGFHQQEADSLLEGLHLNYMINDSIFDDSRQKGSIAAQNPAPGTQVKKNRTIYLTLVAFLPEMIPMPDLNDLSLRQAVTLLETHGLRVGVIENRPDIARNAVMEQKFNNGIIEPGAMIEKGTAIDLVVGQGLSEHRVLVPTVIGQSRSEAINTLNAANLNIGREVFMDQDAEESSFRVYRQEPNPIGRQQHLQAGSTVNIYYRSADLFDFKAYLEELFTEPVPSLHGKSPQEVKQILESTQLVLGEELFEDNVSPEEARVYLQNPEYSEEARVENGTRIDVIYRKL